MHQFLLLLVLFTFTHTAQPKQLLKTKLQITVRDELGNLVKDAEVRLFKTQEDYDKEENPVGETLKTDDKGKITFDDLEPVTYYVVVEKGDLNNDGAGTQTGKLTASRVNKVTIIIS